MNNHQIFKRYLPHFLQLLRFGLVGLIAATLHFSVVVWLVQWHAFAPLVANVIAFMFSFQLSYWGHKQWTFHSSAAMHRVALPKLLLVQSINLIANETLFAFFLMLQLPYVIALLLFLTILPVFTFLASKYWVFGVNENYLKE